MFLSRVIPCLLLHKKLLYKTVKFEKPRYIGDPINAVKIFNEKEVDELMLIDIDATVENREPDYSLIEDIVGEAFMPVCYGGGIRNVRQMRRLFNLGVEKVSISSAVVENPELIKEASEVFGSQSVIVTIDIKKTGISRKYVIATHRGKKITNLNPVDFAMKAEALGAGELVINNIDRDGTMLGYDTEYIKIVTESAKIPVIALGGAGTLDDIRDVVIKGGASAAAVGSMFVYHGRHRAVLINYPDQSQLQQLLGSEKYE